MKRAIILFPVFENQQVIESIRKKYDPLAGFIPPHLTLVFPFDSTFSSEELRLHVEHALAGVKSFRVRLSGFSGDFRDGYLFLNVKTGNDPIIELHDRLYTGILQPFLFRKLQYCPHLTVGKVEQPDNFEKALEELGSMNEQFEGVIDQVCIDNIDAGEHSVPECFFYLE